jgi:glyoxylase-like metal-dependent hydrolase (beta-lactamase superfamily II)
MQDSAQWQTDTAVALLPHVLRLTAPNPGVMTGPGTNTYLVGDMHTGFTIIDPGPADPDHLRRLWLAACNVLGEGGNIVRILCTHSHPDHSPGAAPLQAMCANQPPVMGLPSAPTARAASTFTPDQSLSNKERLTHIGHGLEAHFAENLRHVMIAVHTPGHAANHVCFLLRDDGVLFSGDHILNGSTTVIDPPDGNMTHYLDSLDTLHALCTTHHVTHILPAHGHAIPDALTAIERLKAHRLQREAKIASVMAQNPAGSADDWLPLAYDDVDPRIWPVAKRSLLAHVERIEALAKQI